MLGTAKNSANKVIGLSLAIFIPILVILAGVIVLLYK